MANETEASSRDIDNDYNLKLGRILATPPPGEEVVITGMSGAFPNSNNVHEFRDHLFNKVNMVLPNRRWIFNHPEIPTASGTMPDISKYDAGFFGVHYRQAHSLDAMSRLFQEKTIEAILDAGLHPSDLENTKTGVYVGICFSESEKSWFFDNIAEQSYAWTGLERSMIANRISYFLKLKGPSFSADTACSSSLYAFENAFRALRSGEIDTAIVGGTNLVLHPFVSLQFARLGVLSSDGSCKAFDEAGNGYARSEAVAVLILQRAKDAKRMYAEVIHAKTSCDGYKEQGITYPSGEAQRNLLKEFYEECDIDRHSLSFLEAHGTGTFVGDPEECTAIDAVLAKNRATPLLIGSVKSNIGHSEPASGLCSIIKCIIGMESGFIPPNLHYTNPRGEIQALHHGRMRVVTEKMPFLDDKGLLGINSFGFGGGNCHILLRKNKKEKINGGIPPDNIPRLICSSGRTDEAVTTILDEIKNEKLDVDHIRLLHDAFRKNIPNHLYRGYSIVSKSGEICRFTEYFSGNPTPLYIAFGELNNWYDIGSELMALPIFADSIQRSQKILFDKGVNIMDVILRKTVSKDVYHVLGNVVVQIAIIDVLKILEIKPTGHSGYSIGELLSAYFDGVLDARETLACAFAINQSVNEINNLNEPSNQVNGNSVSNNHEPSHNGLSNGAALEETKSALNSNCLAVIRKKLLQNLSAVLETPKPWNGCNSRVKYASAEYFLDALSSKTDSGYAAYFEKKSLLLEVGDMPEISDTERVKAIQFIPPQSRNPLHDLIKVIGNLYLNGHNPQISSLYPTVDYPVGRGTRMISPYIKWKHNREWFIPKYNLDAQNMAQLGARIINIQLTDHEWNYVDGHVIDGRNLFPATGYLFLAWETLSIINAMPMTVMNVVFENCKFLRATTIPKKGVLQLNVTIQRASGNFEIVEGDSPVVTGRIYLRDEADNRADCMPDNNLDDGATMNTKDIYKELRLRGYNYSKGFRAIQKCSYDASMGLIKWEDNWVTFMDNMLQMKILQTDSRLLYVPTYIQQLIIPAKNHLKWINKCYLNIDKVPNLPVISNKNSGEIRCGNLTITGLLASSIARRKDLGIPVLEKYQFVPNETRLKLEESIRVNMQIILENALVYKIKSVELIDESTKEDSAPLSPIVASVLGDQPLIQPFLKIFSSTPIEGLSVDVEDKKLNTEADCVLVIASKLLQRTQVLQLALASLKDSGFILSREAADFDASAFQSVNTSIFTVHRTPIETLVLLRKKSKLKSLNTIKVTDTEQFSWVSKVQDIIKMKPYEDILLYAEDQPESGILGLVNCLRREPESAQVKCFFIVDKNGDFAPTNDFFADQLKRNMAINIYKNGTWGTYRHLVIEDLDTVESEHCFVNVTVRGDLSSLRWIEGPLRHDTKVPSERLLINVVYASLNFRDIMTASGRINADVVTQNRLEQECVQGFEFAGTDKKGVRYFGLVTHGALSTLILADPYIIFKVPDSMTLEEAATIPVVYLTVIYALIMRAQIRHGDSILIHSGTGGIGQAAIAIALYHRCQVFTTVGSQEKREFLKKTFPQLTDRNIGNSRDLSFEQLVYKGTEGRGVDIVLNSLAEEKLIASIRCLAAGGKFVEIGKFDLANNATANLQLFRKEGSFHGVMLDQLFTETPDVKHELSLQLHRMLAAGAVKPLSKTMFKYGEVEQAFRFMASGKHMGKVVVEVRDSEEEAPAGRTFVGMPRYFCYPEKTYIIAGGLGGFGLELADWLILRGARRLVLTSRKGLSTGYQHSRVRRWRSYGAVVHVSKADITTRNGCRQLMDEANQLGEIEAIFNLAVVLADSLFENQTPQTFSTSFGPKAMATKYLDETSKELCPNLKDFVIFSSVTCGRGNAGQSNYGMANSVMERICEKRKSEGYPALAIQWGAIGEVGLVAEMQEEHCEMEISGTLQQRISSCLSVLDRFLRHHEATIVSSMVVAEKRGGAAAADNIVDAVINILGLNDSKCVSLHATLAELGMDSMTAVEIKQTLEREFEVFLTAKDIRSMTLAKLKEIQEEKSLDGLQKKEQMTEFGIEMIFRVIGDASETATSHLTLPSKLENAGVSSKVILLPGVEGFAKVFEPLASQLNAHVTCVQFRYDTQCDSIEDMAQSIIPIFEDNLNKSEPFTIVAYSFGTLVGLEVVSILETKGYSGTLILIDGSPMLMSEMVKRLNLESEDAFQTGLICHVLSFYLPYEVIAKQQENLFKCSTWEERVTLAIELSKLSIPHEVENQRLLAHGIYNRIQALLNYQPSYAKLTSKIKLFKPSMVSIPDLVNDYGVSSLSERSVDVEVFEGNHFSVLENEALAQAINAVIEEK